MRRAEGGGRRARRRAGGGLVGLLLVLLLAALGGCGGTGDPDQAPGEPPPPVSATTPAPRPTRMPTPTGPPAPLAPLPDGEGGTSPPPPAAGPPDWSFIATADTWKDNPIFRRILSDAVQTGADLVTVGGDITPQGRPEQFDEFLRVVNSTAVPVVVAPGNHDILVSPATFAQYFPLHQSFDHKNAHFTLVDSSRLALDADDLAWIEGDLQSTSQPLKFVVMHVPPFMPFPVPAENRMQAGGAEFVALMERYHVTMVLAGHLQAYQRMQRNGIPYIITGGGGSPPAVPRLLGGRYHYVRVEIRGDTARDSVVWLDDVATPVP
jgi:3',5'-cyclic AMP phosphodiesterase CpdA